MADLALRKARAIFIKDWRLTRAYAGNFARSYITIAGQVLTFYFISKLVGRSSTFGVDGRVVPYFDYVAVNLAFLRFGDAAIGSFQRALRGDQMMGTVEAVLATPTGLPLLILSSSLWSFANTVLQIALFLGISAALGLDLSHVNVLTAAAFLALTACALSPLGVLGAASIMAFKQQPPTSLLVGGIASLLGGALFPVEKLPHWLQAISWLLPITHALRGLRGAVGGATFFTYREDALWLGIMALVFLPLSLAIFGYAVRRAKLDGTLGDY